MNTAIKSSPSITVVIPTLNAEKYLLQTIRSINCQTVNNMEVILVDGGSSDRTVDIFKKEIKKNSRAITVLNKGVPAALEIGFRSAEGRLLTWLNADDVYLNYDSLRWALDSCYAGVDFLYGDFCTLNDQGVILKTHLSWQIKSNELPLGANIFTGALFFRKTTFDEFKSFKSISPVAFEYELLEFLFTHYYGTYVPKVFAGLRIHQQSLTSRYSDQMNADIESIRSAPSYGYVEQRLKKYISLVKSGTLLRKLKFLFRDPYEAKHWCDSFYQDGTKL